MSTTRSAGPRRLAERRWLRDAFICLALLALGLMAQRRLNGLPLTSLVEAGRAALFVLLAIALHGYLRRAAPTANQRLLPLTVLLTGLGLLVQARLDGPLVEPRLMGWMLLPLAGLALIAGHRVGGWSMRSGPRWAWLAGPAAIGVVTAVVVLGERYRGGSYAPGLTTPTELVKPLMVLFLAWYLSANRVQGWRTALFLLVSGALTVALVLQGDLGMLLIIGGLALSLLYVRTGRWAWPLSGLVAGLLVVLAVGVMPNAWLPGPAQRAAQRVSAWLNPWAAYDTIGYQSMQAVFAIHAGGLDGAGLGGGQPQLVPLVRNDLVWAALGEELGLAGCLLLLAAYWAIFAAGLHTVRQRRDERFTGLLAAGCTAVLAVQTLLNVGGVLRLVPMTGITLPLVSDGGSSLLVCYGLVGLLLAATCEGQRSSHLAGQWSQGDDERETAAVRRR